MIELLHLLSFWDSQQLADLSTMLGFNKLTSQSMAWILQK
jgi:hypothetical protein